MRQEEPEHRLLHDPDPDGEAFATVYRTHVDAILRFLAAQRVDAWTAADVTAETFAAALVHRRRYDPSAGPVRAWLIGIARNKLADARRRRVRERRLQERLAIQPIALTESDVTYYEELLVAGGGLTEAQATAISGRIIDDQPYETLSHDMDMPEPTVRQHVSRGLARLRRQLQTGDR